MSTTSKDHLLYSQICQRIRNAMGEFNDENKAIETLVSELAQVKRNFSMNNTKDNAGWTAEQVLAMATRLDEFCSPIGQAKAADMLRAYAATLSQQAQHPQADVAVSDEDVRRAMAAWGHEPERRDMGFGRIKAALESYASRHARQVLDGWQLVPTQCTDEMAFAWHNIPGNWAGTTNNRYRNMLAASPKPGESHD